MPETHAAAHPQLGFWRKYVFSTDHKIIGIQYMITAMAMAVVGGTLSMLMRYQLAWPSMLSPTMGKIMPDAFAGGVMKPEYYVSLVTMHGTIMVFFLFTAVLTGGFGNFLIPLQVGARDMAFPFLNALSYWVFLLSCIVIFAALFVAGGAPLGGWTAYAPLSAVPAAGPGQDTGMTLWITAIALFSVSGLMGTLNYITTILTLRTKGMSMMRLPLTQWSLLVTSILGLLAFPVLLAAGILLLFDRAGGTSFFVPAGIIMNQVPLKDHSGGHPLLWQHLFWFFGHPEVYIVILPAMGMASDILSTFCRKPIFSYRMMVYSMVAIAALSFVVWGHHMFVSGMNPFLGSVFTLTTLLIAVPSAIKTFNWIGTVWGARIRFTVPALFAIAFVSLFVSGGISGIFLGTSAADIQLQDTYFVVAHFHLVMAIAPLFAAFGGVYYWFPKMFGRSMNMTLGKIHFWLSFIGVYSVFFPMHILGIGGQMRRVYDPTQYDFLKPQQPLNEFITIAAFILGAAQLIFLFNFYWSIFLGKRVTERNPWHATTLEWSVPSPPGHGNFGEELPTVHRWAFDFSVPGEKEDFVPQTVPAVVAAKP
ncbi:MAG: cytochrome c oxidase subunit I [Acidobacteria bacterium]|nr:MAG: cytochrome c oxidase subunit I [Acidobacteriota bacterium]